MCSEAGFILGNIPWPLPDEGSSFTLLPTVNCKANKLWMETNPLGVV